MNMKKTISIVISSFNEEKSLPDFGKSLISVINGLINYDFEVLWVNDGSTDDTNKKIRDITHDQFASNVSHVIIEFSKNFGHESAMIAGIDNATGNAIICMDADGQHPPSKISEMISFYENDKDYVLMTRSRRDDNGYLKNILSFWFYKVINYLSEIKFKSNSSDFFLISENIAAILRRDYREKNRFIRGFIQSLGFTHATINYVAPNRMTGESKYSYKKLFQLAVSAIFTFSFKPLRLSLYFAFLFMIFTMLLAIYSVYQYFFGDSPTSGYTTIVLFISFSFTLLFFILSIQLLYFEKLIEEIRKTPIYIIKNKEIVHAKETI